MKALKLTAPGALEIVQLPEPELPRDGIVVQIAACGLTDHDVKVYLGESSSETGILGGQIVGTVTLAGEEVDGFAVGERVLLSRYISCGECIYCRTGRPHQCTGRRELGNQLAGGLTERIAMDGQMLRNGCVAKLPRNLKFEEVGGADATAAVFHAHRCCGIGPGQKLLVLGCGPAGCMHTHIAKLRGVDTIIQADVCASRMEMSRPFMADYLLSPDGPELSETVREVTNGKGVDVCIVAASDPAAMDHAIRETAIGGKIVLFSRFGEKGRQVPVDLTALQAKQLQLLSYDGYTRQDVEEVLWLASKRKINLKWMVTSVVDVTEAAKKMEACRDGKELRVVVVPDNI